MTPRSERQVETLRWRNGRLEMVDQRLLPARIEFVACDSAAAVAQAIRDMVVRGAPAIGCAAPPGLPDVCSPRAPNGWRGARIAW